MIGHFWRGRLRRKARGRFYGGLAASWVVLGLLMLANGRGESVGFHFGISVRTYARTQLGVIAHYLRLAFWPRGLVLDEYGWPLVTSWGGIGVGGWVVAVLGVGTLLALIKKPWLGFLGCWVFVILSPSSSFVPIVTEIAAEHRMYLPLAGVVALVAVGGWELARVRGSGRWRRRWDARCWWDFARRRWRAMRITIRARVCGGGFWCIITRIRGRI